MIKNKLLVVGSILLSSTTTLAISAACSNNKQEVKPSNPSNGTETGSPTNPSETKPSQPESPNKDKENVVQVSKYLYDNSEKAMEYYAPLNGLSGDELIKAIITLQWSKANDTSTNYGSLPGFYNNTDAFKDIFYEKDNSILDIYSENPNGTDPYTFSTYATIGGANEGDGTNREHLIPQSWFKRVEPIRSDAQFVWPTDIKVNNIRSNYPHGEVSNVSYTSLNGSKLGISKTGKKVFEPIDEFKGDIARTYLYFALTYANQDIYNANEVFSRTTPTHLNDEYLQIYLKWNNNDPVDSFDIHRNDQIYKNYRAVRNPFIDYPELTKCLFEGKTFVNKGLLIGMAK